MLPNCSTRSARRMLLALNQRRASAVCACCLSVLLFSSNTRLCCRGCDQCCGCKILVSQGTGVFPMGNSQSSSCRPVSCPMYWISRILMYNQAIDPIFNTKVPRLLLINTKNTPGPRIHPLLDLARNPIRQHGQQSRLGRFHAS